MESLCGGACRATTVGRRKPLVGDEGGEEPLRGVPDPRDADVDNEGVGDHTALCGVSITVHKLQGPGLPC